MQVDASTAVSVISGVLSVAFGLYLALAKYAIGQREREIDRQHNELKTAHEKSLLECATEMRKLGERLNEAEKAAIHQEGALKLVEQSQGELLSDIEEIKRTMVTRTEWEPRMNNLDRTLNQILAEMRGSSGSRYASQSIPSPQPPPFPKKDR